MKTHIHTQWCPIVVLMCEYIDSVHAGVLCYHKFFEGINFYNFLLFGSRTPEKNNALTIILCSVLC